MTTTIPAQTTKRIVCKIPHGLNDWGQHPKMLVEITPSGIWVNCRTCKKAHFIERTVVVAMWERGESVVEGCAQDGPLSAS